MRKSILLLSVILVCLSNANAQELTDPLINDSTAVLISPEVIEWPPDLAILDTIFLNGNIASIDSIFSYGFKKKSKHYIQDAQGKTTLKAEGFYSSPEKETWLKNGLWSYRNDEGRLLYEVYHRPGRGTADRTARYVNQTLPDGRQLLKNGEGHYIESQSVLGIGEYTGKELSIDSLVYTISDSFKSGPYELWRSDANNEYYLAERGQDGHFSRTSRYTPYPGTYNPQSKQLYFPDGTLSAIMHFKFDKVHGPYHKFHANGQYAEFGNFDEGVKKGVWKTWNEDGELLEALVYAPWHGLGDYYEFYDTGQIKAIGTYGFTSALDSIEVLNPDTYEYTLEIVRKKISTGKIESWQYFDRNGKPVARLPE